MQTVDFTTLVAICSDIRYRWLPSRLEKVYQRDRYTITLALRTLNGRGWLRCCLGSNLGWCVRVLEGDVYDVYIQI